MLHPPNLWHVFYRDEWEDSDYANARISGFRTRSNFGDDGSTERRLRWLRATGYPDEVAREIITIRILAAVRLGERDPVHLLEAALRKRD